MWWIGYAKAGREFEVRDDILGLGAYAWVARKIEPKRVPTRRRPVAVTSPYLSRYVFIDCDDNAWHRVHEVKHLAGSMLPVPAVTAARLLQPFIREIDMAYEARAQRLAAGERIEAFAPGDSLRILEGPLKDHLATFDGIVRGASDLEDKLRARMTLLGGPVVVTLDPLHVTKEATE